eukprot:TRINITY_DN12795_c1_g1_i2.p1 TRINITY_DN12795_c1_g1~~TRINITY_DN12795_c1_g1_i2.p1  ORF type:complete len:1021 (+),score=259.45 TRINITY_DN12795_c1_g1_i2:111-3173(+)
MTRRPSDGTSEPLNAKRAREDGSPMDAASSDREHALLSKVLQPPQPPADKLSLATVGNYLEGELVRLGRQNPAKGLEEGLLFLARGWRRSEDGAVPSTWTGIPALQEAMLTTGLGAILAAGSDEKVSSLLALLESNVPARLMNELLVAAAEDETVPPRLLISLSKPLKGRMLNDSQGGQFAKLIRVLKASKKYPQVLVTSPCLEEVWRPNFEPKFVWRNRKREVIASQRSGSTLQNNSLLGWAISPSALDAASAPPSRSHLTEAGAPEWQGLRRASRQRIDGLQRGTQMKLAGVQAQTAELVDIMLRAGDGPRVAVLHWLGALLTSAEPRGKQGHIIPEGFNFWPHGGQHVVEVLGSNEMAPFERSLNNLLLLQALQAKIHGFPTSGAALNGMTLLLHLCKPIKADQASTFSPFFALRDDVSELLGGWKKEPRFGDEEQLNAAKQAAQADPGYTTAALDKSLFKTQLFWIASKSIGALMLPVAKEAFNSFQAIASVFYEKDPETADVGWREYLLAEASLKEPGFLEKLGHFMDLTFRFLQQTAAGGQEALPPPDASPAWHALPTTILENALDVMDLYRDRTKRGPGIPTGLFAHLDATPVLTLLCIVMASESHVRDPSLRGRAVKLLHRLCMSFPSWQAQLNQPPLLKHFVPCLVGVFVAVEKAIMSYYDLAYRYKYELRVPVMDLFDLCLQHDEHKRVLLEYTRGEGNDKFLKLLTQLVNDTNSQTEEAIRTMKDYQASKNDPNQQRSQGASGGPGGNHDENVGDDEQTEGGEDVYRRSRMNYKEHAKKYFALASRTWKQLWLLTQHCAAVIVDGRTILEQMLHSSLNASLHFLVGPEMKSIKATPAEYEEVGFDPKEMVKQISQIYLFLARANREEVSRIIAKDERYYSGATFAKAVRFGRKYGLLNGKELEEFEGFIKELADSVSQQRAAVDEADIPDEFLCEMMADIMSDPVMFPQSKKVVDRSNAERQILGTDRDPYANTLVKVEDLIAMPELKEKIHKFAKEKGIVLEGGNMFD